MGQDPNPKILAAEWDRLIGCASCPVVGGFYLKVICFPELVGKSATLFRSFGFIYFGSYLSIDVVEIFTYF